MLLCYCICLLQLSTMDKEDLWNVIVWILKNVFKLWGYSDETVSNEATWSLTWLLIIGVALWMVYDYILTAFNWCLYDWLEPPKPYINKKMRIKKCLGILAGILLITSPLILGMFPELFSIIEIVCTGIYDSFVNIGKD